MFRLVELTRLKLATTRKEERERSINSIISPSLPSAVLPCFLPILSHHCFSAEKLNHEVVTGRDLTIVCIFIISPLKLPISGCYRDELFISPPSSKLLLITVNIICRENSLRLFRGVNDPDILVKRPAESPGGMTVTIFKVKKVAMRFSIVKMCVLRKQGQNDASHLEPNKECKM